MKPIFLRILLTSFIIALFTSVSFGANPTEVDSLINLRKENKFIIKDRSLSIYDVKVIQPEDWTKLYRIPEHPGFDSLLTPEKEREILAEINTRRAEFGKDTMLTSDYFYIWRPYFDWLQNEDPHYRVTPRTMRDASVYKDFKTFINSEGMKRLPFTLLCVGDTIVIHRSGDPLFKTGDMLLSINGVPIPEYLKYNYSDRYMIPFSLMLYYYYSFAVDRFDIKLVREGKQLDITTTGQSEKEIMPFFIKEEYDVQIFDDAKCGYVQIKEFYPKNSRLINIVHSAVKNFKSKGCTNVILDLRMNPGGSGHAFDKLISIFTNKPNIQYLRGESLKVSKATLKDYDFLTENMIGQLVEIPEKDFVKEFNTDPKMYVGGMKYYILISKDTGSIAASFANILQYNDAATLVGEPLRRNALQYGEEIDGDDLLPTILRCYSISTKQLDEYTKAVDGVVMPDIYIPYVAADYLTGKDGMLGKLLDILRKNK